MVGGNHPRCCGMMCPRITSLRGISKEGGPSGDEGSRDGLAQGFRVQGSGGLWRGRVGGGTLHNPAASALQLPPVSTPKTTKRQRPGWTSSGHVRFLDLRTSRSAVPAYCPLRCRGPAWLVRGETMVVSMANWLPPQRSKPFAMTSIRWLLMRWTVGMLRFESRVCVVILAHSSWFHATFV